MNGKSKPKYVIRSTDRLLGTTTGAIKPTNENKPIKHQRRSGKQERNNKENDKTKQNISSHGGSRSKSNSDDVGKRKRKPSGPHNNKSNGGKNANNKAPNGNNPKINKPCMKFANGICNFETNPRCNLSHSLELFKEIMKRDCKYGRLCKHDRCLYTHPRLDNNCELWDSCMNPHCDRDHSEFWDPYFKCQMGLKCTFKDCEGEHPFGWNPTMTLSVMDKREYPVKKEVKGPESPIFPPTPCHVMTASAPVSPIFPLKQDPITRSSAPASIRTTKESLEAPPPPIFPRDNGGPIRMPKCKYGYKCIKKECEYDHPLDWDPEKAYKAFKDNKTKNGAGNSTRGSKKAKLIAQSDADYAAKIKGEEDAKKEIAIDKAQENVVRNVPQEREKEKEKFDIINVALGLKSKRYEYYSDTTEKVAIAFGWKYRTRHVLKIGTSLSQIKDLDLRAEYMQGSTLKYNDPQAFTYTYKRTIMRRRMGCCWSGWEKVDKYWLCGSEKLEWQDKGCFSSELLSHVTTQVNLNLMNDNKTAWERINQTVRNMASININRYSVLDQNFLSVGTTLVCYFMMRLCKYQHRKADFQPLPKETQDTLYMDTALEKSTCLRCLSPKWVRRLLSCAPVRECFDHPSSPASDVTLPEPVILTPTIPIIIPSLGESKSDLCQGHLNQTSNSCLDSDDSLEDGLPKTSNHLNPTWIQALKLGWSTLITQLGEKLNCCKPGRTSMEYLLIDGDELQSIPMSNLSSKMKHTPSSSTPVPLIPVAMNLNAAWDQFSS